MTVTTPKVVCSASAAASSSGLGASALKKAAVKPVWILKSGMAVCCVPELLSSLAYRSRPVSTPRRSALPSGTSCSFSTYRLSVTPTTSFLLYLSRRWRGCPDWEISLVGTAMPVHGWCWDKPFMMSKKWQTLISSLLRPPQASTKDQEIPSVTA